MCYYVNSVVKYLDVHQEIVSSGLAEDIDVVQHNVSRYQR